VKDRSGKESFSINAEAVISMEDFINNLIKDIYRQENIDVELSDPDKPELEI